jgi:hypothetical protein
MIAAEGLGRGDQQRAATPAPDRDDVLNAVTEQRLTGLAIESVHSRALELTEHQLDDLFERHEDQLAVDLRLERLLCDAGGLLDDAEIEYRVLKGPLLAHTVYGNPSLRSFGDIDLLVTGRDFDRVVDLFADVGFRRRFVEPRRGFDARFSKGACLEGDDGLEIDLHRTLAPGPFGMMLGRADLMHRPAHEFSLGGRTLAGLDRGLAFLHACFHATLGNHPPRLVPLRDIAELARAGFDEVAVMELATSVQCASVLRRAVELVQTDLGVVLDGELARWARSQVPSRFDRWALRTYERDDRSYAAQAALSLWTIPSIRERVAYASALALPSRAYVGAREGSYARRLRRGVRLTRELRPR